MTRIIVRKQLFLIVFAQFIFAAVQTSSAQDITLDTIEAENSHFIIQLKPAAEESTFDNFFKYFKDILGPLVALVGILLTLPILRKKLAENHITNALSKIQEINVEVQKSNQKLIDKYLPLTYLYNRLEKGEIESVFIEVKKIYYLSQEGSGDVVTILFYLKNTLQGVLRHFDDKSNIYSKDIYGLVIDSLELTNFYCTQVVQIPKSSETEARNLINEKIRKYVTHADYEKYKHFNQGVINDPNSAHYLLFYELARQCLNSLIKRTAFKIHQSTSPIIKSLYLHNLYAPPELEKQDHESIRGKIILKLHLIDFSIRNQIIPKDGTRKKVVVLTYSNMNDVYHFVNNLGFDELKTDFKDSFMAESKFKLIKASQMAPNSLETFTLQFDKEYLENSFKENRSKIKRKLKQATS